MRPRRVGPRSPRSEADADRSLSHRRPADSRAGRGRMGAAALDLSSSSSSTTMSRRRNGSRSSIAWACRRTWTCTFSASPMRPRASRLSTRTARPGILLTGIRRDDARSRAPERRRDSSRERRRHPSSRRSRSEAALRLSQRRTKSGAARARRRAASTCTAQDVPSARPVSLDDRHEGRRMIGCSSPTFSPSRCSARCSVSTW